MTLSQTQIQWGTVTFYGSRGHDFTLDSFEGWRDWGTRQETVKRPRSHGTFDAPAYADDKTVMAGGLVAGGANRDALLAALEAALVPGELADLTVTEAGRTLTTSARLVRRAIPNVAWGVGIFRWAAQWTCPDPLRYGTATSTYTGFPQRTGGLRWPMYSDGAGANVGATDWGPVGTTGRASVSNAGTAQAWPQFQVVGPVPVEGFEIVTVGSGARLRYVGAVPSTSSLVIDTATGLVLIDGKYDRVLSVSEPEPIEPGGSAEYQFVNLGATSDAVLTVTVRPAYW